MSALRVGVSGAFGRMGEQTCRAIEGADDLQLVARIGRDGTVEDAERAGVQTLVDFTKPTSVMATVEAAIAAGIHVVAGTSGFDAQRLAAVEDWLKKRPGVGVVIAPNFALGAALMLKFARQAAAHFESVEVIELHHPDKLDAPSATAVQTAQMIAAARAEAGRGASPDATTQARPGARGAIVDDVTIHSVRLRGLIAHEEVLFGNTGETLTVRHDSYDRAAFMPGVLLAIRQVIDRPGLTFGIESMLDID